MVSGRREAMGTPRPTVVVVAALGFSLAVAPKIRLRNEGESYVREVRA